MQEGNYSQHISLLEMMDCVDSQEQLPIERDTFGLLWFFWLLQLFVKIRENVKSLHGFVNLENDKRQF
jgi:hypothetical protein